MNWIRQILLPLAILITGLGVTWVAWNHEHHASQKTLQAQFEFSLREAVTRIEQRIVGYEQMLHGAQGLFLATGKIDRVALTDYVRSLNLDANFSGVQAIGVEELVPDAEKNAHIKRMQKIGFSDYAIRPAGERLQYAPITMLEPYEGINRIPFGFDAWSEPIRRRAMEAARDSGRPAISGKVDLEFYDNKTGSASFLMYLPIYARGQPHSTIAERRNSLIGWVHASFRMSDIIASLYGEQLQGLTFTIYDGVEISAQTLMYQSREIDLRPNPDAISASEYLVLGGHTWTFIMKTQPEFKARFGRNAETQTALVGFLLTLLLALLAWLLMSSRQRALRLAKKMTSELRASKERFRAIADCTVNWEVWWGLDMKPHWINPSVFEYTGYTVDECMNMTDMLKQLIYADDFPRVFPELTKGLRGERGKDLEFRCVRKNGSLFWLSVSWLPLTDVNGVFIGFRTSGRDISERKLAEAELRISAVAFESMEGVMITDAESRVLRVNHAFTRITGYSAAEIIGQTPNILRSERHAPAFFRDIWETVRLVGGWQGEIWNRHKNGKVYPEWLTISAVKSDDGVITHYVATHHDITERKIAEERIKELAFFDALTRLPNRTLLLDRLKQAIAIGTRNKSCSALLFIDLDHFKTLNDTLGHDKGDLLLKQVAQRLSTSVRANDTVARVGGDEFVVVLEDLHIDPQEAANQTKDVGEKILEVLSSYYQLGDVEYRTTASVGATIFQGDQSSIDDLLKQADLAMYKFKATGRNAMRFFDPAMQTVVLERAALEDGLRRAIEANQLVLHYQAQVVEGRKVTGAEVLVRWLHPQRGMVPPSEFIPLAEETGLILELGNWVLETACKQLVHWADVDGLSHLTIAVNVSAHQFREADFVESVLSILTRTGANPQLLKLELTESLLVDNVEDIIEKMNMLKAYGVEFSLDDFGIGYSSLSYLKRLPLNQLKIDQSFVRDVLVDPNDASIAKTIVALAQSLNLGVIAEGVETDAQRSFLADAGCYAFQGYFFCRPLPVDGFEKFALAYDPVLE